MVEVLSVAAPEAGQGAVMIGGDAVSAAKELVDKLRREARVL